ncbi:PREDICTED: regulator of cell cycle RGCC-like [Calidris pugnax]|uniref:regulator of cell cycle RGCC-like n=1 Tax=Calidris pugnax TaxID=198806 RepID=UPI00071C9F40|nr:PREDICTED: regulator of cell cycle RGCC-like [Calidris pugnax]
MAEELSDLLREFDEVMEDFDRGPASQYEQHLEELKRKAGHSVYDSGIDELESTSTSPGSSLNSSEEDLNTPADGYPSKAKLGDMQELEEFIADLDKALEGLMFLNEVAPTWRGFLSFCGGKKNHELPSYGPTSSNIGQPLTDFHPSQTPLGDIAELEGEQRDTADPGRGSLLA